MTQSRTVLEIRLDQAATPERVEAAARMFALALKAAYPNLPADSVTMVVTNYTMGAGVRPRTPEGRKAVQQVLTFMKNPTRALQRNPGLIGIAEAVLGFRDEVGEETTAQLVAPGAKRPVAVLDAGFSRVMRQLAQGQDRPAASRGKTTVYATLLRVGRSDEGKHLRARLRIDDHPQDVHIADAAIEKVFDAAKSGRVLPIHLDATWIRDASGRLLVDARRTTITDVNLDWQPQSGEALLDHLRAALPGLSTMPDEEFMELLKETGGGS